MKIIDMRFRPPYKAFRNDAIYDLQATPARYARRGITPSPALMELSMGKCLEEMNEAGIVKGLIPLRALRSEADAESLVSLLNKDPEHFIGFISISMPHEQTEAGIKTIEDFIINGPCTGISLEPGLDAKPWYSDDERIFPIYEKCEKTNTPVMILAGGLMHRLDAGDCDYYNPSHLEHVARVFPNLKIILAHGGWPWITQACYLAMNWDNVYLSPDCYLIDGVGGNLYAQAANNYVLQDKVLFGSNFPGYSMKEAINRFIQAGIKESVLPKIFYENAATVLGLK